MNCLESELTTKVAFWIADSFNLNTFGMSEARSEANISHRLGNDRIWFELVAGSRLCHCRIQLGRALARSQCSTCKLCVEQELIVQGAIFGITFPAVCRTTFGVFGSLWPVFNRECSGLHLLIDRCGYGVRMVGCPSLARWTMRLCSPSVSVRR